MSTDTKQTSDHLQVLDKDTLGLVAEWDHPDPFQIRAVVGQADIDSYHHANNSVYVRWLVLAN